MQNKVFKPTGLMPRSIPRTIRRFIQQLNPRSEQRALEEFRISREQALVSLRCLFYLLGVPLMLTWGLKVVILRPAIQHFWNTTNQPIFLNSWQRHRAFLQVQEYKDQHIFDEFLVAPDIQSPMKSLSVQEIIDRIGQDYSQEIFTKLAQNYNTETIVIVTNVVSDFCCFLIFITLYQFLRPQRQILVRFITDTLYGFSDTSKAFLVLLVTDLLVGYHSPMGWEVSLEAILQHFGFAPHKNVVYLVVATVPVFLSTIFKYGIFRYLNRISPSTVAIYHNMIE